MPARRPRSVLFLPLSAQVDDAETIAWCRAVPLLVAEGFAQLGRAQAGFAIWTSGAPPDLKLCHLQQPAPDSHVAAYAQAAGAALAFTGWASWHGDPFVRWDVIATDGRGRVARLPSDGVTRVEVARAAWGAAASAVGGDGERLPAGLRTESEDAMISYARDREALWARRRRGLDLSRPGYRYLLSSLTCDPGYEAPAREVLRRAGEALVGQGEGWESHRPARADATEALEATVRLRPRDHVAWTLLGMLHRADDRVQDAKAALSRAASLDPDYAPAHRELGSVLLDLGELRGAGAHLRKAGGAAPRDPEVHLYLGALHVALSQKVRATEHLRAVLKLAGGTVVAGQAARLLRDLDEGPVRTVTNPLASRPGERRGEPAHARSRDHALIARTFGFAEVVPSRLTDVSMSFDPQTDIDITFTD